jgi:hypothetical protein
VAAAATTSPCAGASSTSGTGAASRVADVGGAVPSAASARPPSVAGSGAPPACPSSVVGRRVLGGASFVVGNAGDPALLSCCSFGTPSGDKWNAGHSDPVPLRHELGQGWSAAKPNLDAIINTLLQPRPYLQNNGGNMSK